MDSWFFGLVEGFGLFLLVGRRGMSFFGLGFSSSVIVLVLGGRR